MSPALVPTMKDLAARVQYAEAKEIVRAALELKTTDRVQRYLTERVRRLAPDLKLFEVADA
jgi:hypothetical protein